MSILLPLGSFQCHQKGSEKWQDGMYTLAISIAGVSIPDRVGAGTYSCFGRVCWTVDDTSSGDKALFPQSDFW